MGVEVGEGSYLICFIWLFISRKYDNVWVLLYYIIFFLKFLLKWVLKVILGEGVIKGMK